MRRLVLPVLAVALAAAMVLGTWEAASAGKPQIGKPCVQCHKGAPDVVRGKLGTRSEKFSTINVQVGKLVWVIKYDGATKVSGAASLDAVPKGKEIAVTFTGNDKTAKATAISVKQPYKTPEEQIASLSYVKEMAAKGPEAGDFLLVDARPTPKYLEGHIPGAVSMPYAAFDKMHAQVLPKEKGTLIIFYCGGTT